MQIIATKQCTITLATNDWRWLSTPDKIQHLLATAENVIAFNFYAKNKLAAFALLRQNAPGSFFLWDFAVATAFQGQGYGKQVLTLLIQHLKEYFSLTRLTTTYLTENQRAKKLYARVGFQVLEIINEENCQEIDLFLPL